MRTRRPHPSRSTLLVLAAGILFGCGATVVPSPPAFAPTTPVPATDLECQDVKFDPAASLGPEFANDNFLGDESEVIAGAFIAGLAGIYARRPNADPCAWFTTRGLRTAMETDARLRDAIEGRSSLESDLAMRIAFESTYDLRISPPTVPLSIVFDLPAGSRTTDLRSGATTVSPGDQRAGLHVDLVYDGRRWRADRVGTVEGDDAAWLTMPTPLPPGDPCARFVLDPAGMPFDEASGTDFLVEPARPGRRWCDADGKGRRIEDAQLALVTRYPCNRARAAVLTIGLSLGMPIDPLARNEFVRDPAGDFLAQGWITAPFEPAAKLPADAAYTGWTNGNIELWISPSDLANAIYVRVGDAMERWPRAADEWGVIDCN